MLLVYSFDKNTNSFLINIFSMETNVSVEIIIKGRNQHENVIGNADTRETFVEDVGPNPFIELVSKIMTHNNLQLIKFTLPKKKKTRNFYEARCPIFIKGLILTLLWSRWSLLVTSSPVHPVNTIANLQEGQ